MAWPSTFVAGNPLTAAQLNGIQALGLPWTSFTPTLTSTGTAPTATYTGSGYVQAGKLTFFRANITIVTPGTGTYSITLPASAKASTEQTVHGHITDTGTGQYSCVGRTGGGSTTLALLCEPSTAGNILRAVTATAPMTFAAGDLITIEGFYEAA